MKETVRLSFDVPVNEHTLIKMECAKARIPIREFLHYLVLKGMKEYKENQMKERLKKSLKESKKGKGRIISKDELDEWEKSLDNE